MDDATPNMNRPFPILIADDNLLLRTMLEANLKAIGYEVVCAENGKEALELYRKGNYPIVMTDWVMPEMSGLELCRAIREDETTTGYTYIIIFTSQDSKNDIIAGLEAGADEYLVKPVHQAELQARLKTARRILELEASQRKYLEEIQSLYMIDPVTGMFNRRYMDDRLPQEIKRAYRYEHSLSVVLVAIDNFDQVKATHGHFSGDLVLKGCADCLMESVRKEVDWIARYDEARFVVVLPETTSSGAMIVAKRLRIRVAAMAITMYDQEIRVTAGFGVAGFTASQQKPGFMAEILMDKADRCLDQAMEEGAGGIKGIQIN